MDEQTWAPRMTPKQRSFVTEYMVDRNPEAAYLRTGYTGKNAAQLARKLLKLSAVKSEIEKLESDERLPEARARVVIDPVSQGALTVRAYGEETVGRIEILRLTDALTELSDRIVSGDLDDVQKMLAVQAHTLDGIYNKLVRQALGAELLEQFEVLFKLALRAQSQCRATVEALSVMQNPPVATYVNQANIAGGHQQINNTPPPAIDSNETPPSKLLEPKDHEPHGWVDRRAPQAPSAAHPRMEAVDGINGAEDGKGQV